MPTLQELRDIAITLRKDSIIATTEAGSGHPTSCMSCADILAVLFFSEMRYDSKNPSHPNNDEFILSKGHAAPILYSALFRAGCIKDNLKSLRKLDSNLEGHPSPKIPWVKYSSGSLGQGLSIGVGYALSAKLSKRSFKTYVLLGDSESAEGSVFEAAQLASHYSLNNLIAILDINRLGQTNEAMLGHNIKAYEQRWKSLGWNTISINGHDIKEIQKAFSATRSASKPSIILAKTHKGHPVSFLDDKEGRHGKALSQEEAQLALQELPKAKVPKLAIKKPLKNNFKSQSVSSKKLDYKVTDLIATRDAYGDILARLAESNDTVLAIDGETSNSTRSDKVKKLSESQFIEAFIAEQNMIGMAQGLSIKGFHPAASTFSAFLTRAHDQLRMAAVGKANLVVCGSHAGVSIGEDGPSQMALEDIALFRSLPDSIVLYPSDAVSTSSLVNGAFKLPGIKFIRTSRPKTPIIYSSSEQFPIPGFKVLQSSNKDKVTIVTAGITVHEALKAYISLKKQNIPAAILDLYCIKPLDSEKLKSFIQEHGNNLIMVEDHYKEGGLGEAVLSAIKNASTKTMHLSVNEIPRSGRKEELLEKYQIDSKAMVKAAHSILKEPQETIQNHPEKKKKTKKKKRR